MIRKVSSYVTATVAAALAAGYAVVFAYAMTARSWSFKTEDFGPVAVVYYSFVFEVATSQWAYAVAAIGAVVAAAIALFLFPPAKAKMTRRRSFEIRLIAQAVLAASLILVVLETRSLLSQFFLYWDGNPRVLAGGMAEAGWRWIRDGSVLFASWVVIWAFWSTRQRAISITELSSKAIVSISSLALVLKVAIIAVINNIFAGDEPQYFILAAVVAGAQLLILLGVLRLGRRVAMNVAEETA
jgi:hypothetical protein